MIYTQDGPDSTLTDTRDFDKHECPECGHEHSPHGNNFVEIPVPEKKPEPIRLNRAQRRKLMRGKHR